ncbi:MAG: GTP-binding protein [Myxococcales bacterium]|nr:GTP-binding protein [Myxococcales bacterium]
MSALSPALGQEEESGTSPVTPLLLLTGFLGSGKTTLLNRWLASPGHPRIGVVVNEFGQVGIDGKLLPGTGILELSNGCVCCVRGTELWESALELVDRAGAEVLVVETSGLVEPQALLTQYELLPKHMASRLTLRGLVCVVDPQFVAEAVERRAEARHQLELADRVLMSKLDLASAEELLSAHRLLTDLAVTSDRAGLSLRSSDQEVAEVLRWAFQPRQEPRRKRASLEVRHGASQLAAVSVRLPHPLLEPPLRVLLSELPGTILRAKGFVKLYDGPGLPLRDQIVHLAGHRVELQTPSPEVLAALPPEGALVFIGEHLDESWLRLRLSACTAPLSG